jgi:hypothetical protein
MMTTTTTTSRAGRPLASTARLARMRELVEARAWSLVVDEPRGLYSARRLEWQGPKGLRVGWTEYHEQGVRTLWVEAETEAERDETLERLCAELPTWSAEALQREAHSTDLGARLTAMRTWTVAATIDPAFAPGAVEALVALARHEHPIARLAAWNLAWIMLSVGREAIHALARERAEQDTEYAEHWQHLLGQLEASQ